MRLYIQIFYTITISMQVVNIIYSAMHFQNLHFFLIAILIAEFEDTNQYWQSKLSTAKTDKSSKNTNQTPPTESPNIFHG